MVHTGGDSPGITDEALLESVMYLPDDVLLKIKNFMDLDTEDSDDAAFIELYCGLFTLARAANVIDDHDLLHQAAGVAAPESTDLVPSGSDDAYVSDLADTPVKTVEVQASLPTSECGIQATSDTLEVGTQADPQVSHATSQTDEPPVKRRKITIEVSEENGNLVAHIPLGMNKSATVDPHEGDDAPDVLMPDQPQGPDEDALEDVQDVAPPRRIRPQDVPKEQRLQLLGGNLLTSRSPT